MIINTRCFGLACGAIGLLSLISGRASAATFTEVGTSAGETLATAEDVTGTGPLTSITGSLAFTPVINERYTDDISIPALFEIDITSAAFSATTLGQPGTLEDPMLFLFNSAGNGVLYNDDASAYTHAALLSATSLTPGLYYLGIATGAVPRSGTGKTSAGDIFPNVFDTAGDTDPTVLTGPTGPGAGAPLATWDLTDADVETGSFTIALSGASFAPAAAAVPEPSSVALLALGLLPLGLAVKQRRARRA